MKPTLITTYVLAILAGQPMACAVQDDVCCAAKLGDLVCGCYAKGNLVRWPEHLARLSC